MKQRIQAQTKRRWSKKRTRMQNSPLTLSYVLYLSKKLMQDHIDHMKFERFSQLFLPQTFENSKGFVIVFFFHISDSKNYIRFCFIRQTASIAYHIFSAMSLWTKYVNFYGKMVRNRVLQISHCIVCFIKCSYFWMCVTTCNTCTIMSYFQLSSADSYMHRVIKRVRVKEIMSK